MLRGLKDPGPAFEWSPSEHCFRVSNETFLPEMSEAALAGILQRFADMGTIAVKYVTPMQSNGKHSCMYNVIKS